MIHWIFNIEDTSCVADTTDQNRISSNLSTNGLKSSVGFLGCIGEFVLWTCGIRLLAHWLVD